MRQIPLLVWFAARAGLVLWATPAAPAAAQVGGYQAIISAGSVQSGPGAAVARGAEEMDVVVRGTDNSIYLARWTGAAWTGWTGLGAPPGGATGDPAAAAWAPGRLDVFVRGSDSKLWQRFRATAGTAFSDWIQPVGNDGVLASAPGVSSRGPGRLDLFALGTDGNVYQRFFQNDTWNSEWLGQGEPDGPVGLMGDPASASGDDVRVDLFSRGTDGRLWARTWNGSSWSAWAPPVPDGQLTSSPDVTSGGPGHLFVAVRGTDTNVYANEFRDGRWFGWVRESATGVNPIQNGPAVVARGIQRTDIFVRGTDDLCYQAQIFRDSG